MCGRCTAVTCEGTVIEPAAMSQTPKDGETDTGAQQKSTLDLGQGAISAAS